MNSGHPNPSLTRLKNISAPLSQILNDRHHSHREALEITLHCLTLCDTLHPAELYLCTVSLSKIIVKDNEASLLGDPIQLCHLQNITPSTPLAPETQHGELGKQADIFFLGTLLYRLLSNEFPSQDPMGNYQPNMAKHPTLPKTLVYICQKCLFTHKEDRYKTLSGLQKDLEKCLKSLKENRQIPFFFPGEFDTHQQLLFSSFLYGRENEEQAFDLALKNVQLGNPQHLLLRGKAGVGKSSLLTLFKSKCDRNTTWIYGKFDQINTTPLAAISKALSDYFEDIMNTELFADTLRPKLLEVLSHKHQAICEIIPPLRQIFSEVSTREVETQLEQKQQYTFAMSKLIELLFHMENTFVFCLDDVQWCDAASVEFISTFLLNNHFPNVQFIFAYRPKPTQLIQQLESLDNADLLPLQNLSGKEVKLWLSNVFSRDPDDLKELAEAICSKTNGNPFFIRQFLHTATNNKRIQFNNIAHQWEWDLGEIEAENVSDNVGDLLSNILLTLPADTLEILSFGACFGTKFDTQLIADLLTLTQHNVELKLWPALAQQLIRPSNKSAQHFLFCHDKILQSAYTHTSKPRRQKVHDKIGKTLFDLIKKGQSSLFFECADHLNKGGAHKNSERNKLVMAEANLAACTQAIKTAAYKEVSHYALKGLSVIQNEHWKSHNQLCFKLHLFAFESEFVHGNEQASHAHFETALSHSNIYQQAELINKQTLMYGNIGNHQKSYEIACEGLALFGEKMPNKFTKLTLLLGSLEIIIRLKIFRQDISSLKTMTHPKKRGSMSLYVSLMTSTYLLGKKDYFAFLMIRMTQLSLRHGNTPESYFGYAMMCHIFISILEDFDMAKKTMIKIENCLEDIPDSSVKMQTKTVLDGFAKFYFTPLNHYIKTGYSYIQKLLDHSDVIFAGYQIFLLFPILLDTGKPRSYLEAFIAERSSFLDDINESFLSFSLHQFHLFFDAYFPTTAHKTRTNVYLEKEIQFQKLEHQDFLNLNIYTTLQCLMMIKHNDYDNLHLLFERLNKKSQDKLGLPLEFLYRFSLAASALLAQLFPSPNSKKTQQALYKKFYKKNLTLIKKMDQYSPNLKHYSAFLTTLELWLNKDPQEEVLFHFELAIENGKMMGLSFHLALFARVASRYCEAQALEKEKAHYLWMMEKYEARFCKE